MSQHAKTRVGGPVAAGAVVLVALQVLQGAINSFNPRVSVTVLIAVLAGCTTYAVNRYRSVGQADLEQREQVKALRRALRAWPPQRVVEADPYRVGVFPPRRSNGDSELSNQYAARDVDGPLRGALEQSGVVVVFGPRGAGKSRTSFEAMRDVHGAAPVIAPVDADALRQVIDLDVAAADNGSESGAVVWLDSLERFVPAIDAGAIEQLESHGATIVATIRTDDYDALLEASGHEGEAAKALVARARAFEVPAALTATELEEAEGLYPGVDFAKGFSHALSGTGKEGTAPRSGATSGPPTADGPSHLWLRDRRMLISMAGALSTVIAISVIAATIGVPKPSPLSLGEQVDEIKSDATGAKRQLLGSGIANFHGFGDPSYWFIFGPSDDDTQKTAYSSSPLAADEIRIYDQRGGKLRQEFRFQPQTPAARFKFRYGKDLDGDGEAELIGGYGLPSQSSEALMPVAVHWASGTGRYRITSLQTTPVRLQGEVTPTTAARRYLASYQQALTLKDGDLEVTGYRMQSFVVTKNPQLLIKGLAVDPKSPSRTGRVQVQAGILRIGDQPELIPCRLGNGAVRADWPTTRWTPGQDLRVALEDGWNQHDREERCVP